MCARDVLLRVACDSAEPDSSPLFIPSFVPQNRSNSYVRNGVLYLKPTLTADNIGEANLNSMVCLLETLC
jgi:hypothetical protein